MRTRRTFDPQSRRVSSHLPGLLSKGGDLSHQDEEDCEVEEAYHSNIGCYVEGLLKEEGNVGRWC